MSASFGVLIQFRGASERGVWGDRLAVNTSSSLRLTEKKIKMPSSALSSAGSTQNLIRPRFAFTACLSRGTVQGFHLPAV